GTTPEPGAVDLPVSWAPLDDLPITAANAFLLQVASGAEGRPAEVLLAVGVLAPPLLGGTAAGQVAQLQRVDAAPVQPIVRLAFSRERAEELRGILDDVIRTWDEAQGS